MDTGGLERGLYEDVLTSALEKGIAELLDSDQSITAELTDAEAADRFALHVATAVRRALEGQPDMGRALLSSQVIGELLRTLDRNVRPHRWGLTQGPGTQHRRRVPEPGTSASERDFWFLGTARYVSHKGSRPLAVVWRLDHAIPADLHPDFAAVGAA